MGQSQRDLCDELCSKCKSKIQQCTDNAWRIYDRLVKDWRHYDNLVWQLPFGTMTAVGVILTLAYHYIPSNEHCVRAALFLALAWFTLTMMHLSYKVRYFQIERSACIEAIEHLCTGFTIPYHTEGAYDLIFKERIKKKELWFYNLRTFSFVIIMYIGLTIALLYLAIRELLTIAIMYVIICIIIIAIIALLIILFKYN